MLDVDGVLVHGRRGEGVHWSTALEQDLGIRFEDMRRSFFRPYWPDIVTGSIPLRAPLAAALEQIAPHVSCDQFIDYWFSQDSWVDAGMLAEIGTLRALGLAVYLATNQEHERAAHLMGEIGLARHVDGIFYSADLGFRKPDNGFFEVIGTRLRAAPDQLVLVDDTADNVEGARRAGWQGLIWTGKSRLSALLAAA